MMATKTPQPGRFFRSAAFALGVLGALLALASWLAPNHYPPWTSFHAEAFAFAALGLLGLAALAAARPAAGWPAAAWATLGLIGVVWVHWRLGLIASFGDAFTSSLYLMGLALALWLGHQSASPPLRDAAVRAAAAVLVGAALVSSYVALLQWLGLESSWGIFAAERGPEMRPFGNLAQPNHLATLVLMASPMAALLWRNGQLRAWQFWTVLLGLSVGLVLSESRSGRLGAFALGAYALWALRATALRAQAVRVVLVWWLMLAALWLARDAASEFLLLQPPRSVSLTQDQARTVMWSQMLAAIREAPWLGYGWRQTIVAQKTGALEYAGLLVTDYAHNIVLDVLLWVGVPLGCALIGVTVLWLLRLARRARSADQVLLFAGVIPFLVHSQFEFPFAYAYFLFPVGWALGLLSAEVAPAPKPTAAGFGLALAAVILAWLALCGLAARDYLLAEEDYRVMRFELRKVGQRPANYEAPTLRWLTQLDGLLVAGRIKPRAGMPASEIELLERVNQGQGWAMLHLTYIAALGLNGQPAQATEELRRLRALYGDVTYDQAVAHLRALQAEPGFELLRAVRVP